MNSSLDRVEPLIKSIEQVFNVKREDLVSPRRFSNLVEARTTFAYLLSTEENFSNDQIAKATNRTPAWASWAVMQCSDRGEVDPQYATKVSLAFMEYKHRRVLSR